jgi:hypothetical protein
LIGKIGLDVQIGLAGWRSDLDFVLLRSAMEAALGALVAVMGEQVSEDLHRAAVGVAAEDAQAAQGASGVGFIAREDAVSGEEEAGAEAGGEERGTEVAGFDQGDGEETEVAEGVEREAGRK